MKGYFSQIQKKLLKIFGTLMLLYMLVSCVAGCIYVSESGKKLKLKGIVNNYEQARSVLESTIYNHYSASYLIQKSAEIQEPLTRSVPEDFMEQYKIMMSMQEKLNELTGTMGIYQISVFVDDAFFLSQNNMQFRSLSELYRYSEFEILRDSEDLPFIWMSHEELVSGNSAQPVKAVSFLRKIGDRVSNPVGYQMVSLRLQNIERIIGSSSFTEGTVAYLYDSNNGKIICSSGGEDIPAEGEIIPVWGQEKLLLSQTDWVSVRTGNKKWEAYARRVRGTDWIYLILVPDTLIDRESIGLVMLWFQITVIVGILGVILAGRLSKSMFERILLLESSMNRMTEGVFDILDYKVKGRRDEIDNLIFCFNDSVKKLENLMEQKDRDARRMRKLELMMLQEQINPHFLYNTLDLIHWKALDAEEDQIANITAAVANYYRLSLGNGREIVALRDEITHIINYVEIQNYRFENVIRLSIEIPEELKNCRLPKLTLQPIVENAIHHGLLRKKDQKDARLHIFACTDAEFVFIKVEDNGVGMSEEQIQRILSRKEEDLERGYGVRNVDERLKLCFDRDCGLFYDSVEGRGTTAVIKIRSVCPQKNG